MEPVDKQLTRLFHHWRVEIFGEGTVRSLGWKNEHSQLARFEVLCRLTDFSRSSVLDLGCGYGDFRAALENRATDLTYVGLDQMRAFVLKARRRYGHYPRTHFIHCDFDAVDLPRVDYAVASGALAYRTTDTDAPLKTVERMFRAARKAVAFNMLDATTFKSRSIVMGHDRKRVVEACKRLSPRIEVVDGYLDHDFTVFLRH